ncbi:hypothetical protein GPECTOR_15g435 [Gonium pectorale]|uniref:Uncharacterized protein n=1 Tax=Gonium pectorale TaxID=33097 RepID=A0A150GN28_GONPE|nr:hypothetical protein GPECTOR_15g435 [Gonium pectorale]|eukprot:KXZ50750.1 hypothetical protein GPECTOR_15g435 [Gonium pectorale]
MGNALSLTVSIGVPLVGGIVGGLVTQKDVLTWYPKIKKPRWTPPNFLFGPVWTALYAMMGTASWIVWKGKGKNTVALSLYGAQLVLNLIWNPLFFKTHKTDVALVDITALLGLATAATVEMTKVSSAAVQLPLMVPYLVWVSYATALNANIWANNPTERLIKSRKQKEAEGAGATDPARPGNAVKEAAKAAKTGMETVKAATEAVSAGSATVQHASAAAAPVVSAAGAVKSAAESVSGAVKSAGAALGVVSPTAVPPPSDSAGGSTPSTMAPASKAIAKEVQRAAAAASPPPASSPKAGGGSGSGVGAAIERELKQAGAL